MFAFRKIVILFTTYLPCHLLVSFLFFSSLVSSVPYCRMLSPTSDSAGQLHSSKGGRQGDTDCMRVMTSCT